MNRVINRSIWSSFALAAIATLAVSTANADDLGTIEVTGTRPDEGSTYNGGSITLGIGGSGGPRIHGADPVIRQQIAADAAKARKVKQCKDDATTYWQGCNQSQTVVHAANTTYCRGAFWLGGALGVAGGWAAIEGEGGAFLLLGGSSYAVLQWGSDCQGDMDRAYNAGIAQCNVTYQKMNDGCEAL